MADEMGGINDLSTNAFIGLECAETIKHAIITGKDIPTQALKNFCDKFKYIYNRLKDSIDTETLNTDLINHIDQWFVLIKEHPGNTKLLTVGIDLYIKTIKDIGV